MYLHNNEWVTLYQGNKDVLLTIANIFLHFCNGYSKKC